jgi:ClpP class serine protease
MEQAIRNVADGRIVLGSQALKVGLIDELGDLYAAEEGLRKLARERFNMGDKAELPLKNHDSPTDFFSLMGFGLSGQWASQLSNTTEASVTQALLPMSVRYSNQPLWLYE